MIAVDTVVVVVMVVAYVEYESGDDLVHYPRVWDVVVVVCVVVVFVSADVALDCNQIFGIA